MQSLFRLYFIRGKFFRLRKIPHFLSQTAELPNVAITAYLRKYLFFFVEKIVALLFVAGYDEKCKPTKMYSLGKRGTYPAKDQHVTAAASITPCFLPGTYK